MNVLSSALPAQGFLWTIFLFLLCLILVHAFKLSKIGYRSLRQTPPEEQPKEQEKKPEPVYYLVEKTKKRSKTQYSSPREVTFK